MGVVFLLGGIIIRIDIQALGCQRRSHVILGGKGVGACDIHFGASCSQHLAQIGCLCFKMDGKGYALAGKGLFPGKILLQAAKKGAVFPDPVYLVFSTGSKGNIANIV